MTALSKAIVARLGERTGQERTGQPLRSIDRCILRAQDAELADYVLEYLFVAHHVRERVAGTVLQWLPRRMALWCVGHTHHDIDTPSQVVAEHAAELFRETALAGQRLRWILVQDYPGSARQRWLLVLFSQQKPGPSGVLKLQPIASPGRRLLDEYRVLESLASRLPPRLRSTVPVPLAHRTVGHFEALLLTALPGRSAYVDLHRDLLPHRRLARHFDRAAWWLTEFHTATRRSRGFTASIDDVTTVDALSLARTHARSADELRWYEDLRRVLLRKPLPLVMSHGDFWARNLLIASETTGAGPGAAVVDWEHATPEGLPSDDLFQFPLTYGLNYPWSRYRRLGLEEAFELTFLRRNPVSKHVARYFRAYCAGTGLDPAVVQPLFHLYLLIRASQSPRSTEDVLGVSAADRPNAQPLAGRDAWLRCHAKLARARESVFAE